MASNVFGQRTWADALSDANGLHDGIGGLTDGSVAGDWRLPNFWEIQSLVDYDKKSPALPAGHPFTGVLYSYWSSTTYTLTTIYAWGLNFLNGMTSGYDKSISGCYVWCVRGGS